MIGDLLAVTGLQIRLLHRLARLYGVETAFYDNAGRRRLASPQSLLAVLQVLGAPVERLADVSSALREGIQKQWRRYCEPAAVAWNREPVRLQLRLPAELTGGIADCRLELENGKVWRWSCHLARLPVLQAVVVEGMNYEVRQLKLPSGLPLGYHWLTITLPARHHKILLISAPRQAYGPVTSTKRLWGIFVPLYALHSGRSWGAGDLTDLETLLGWVHEQGGDLVGTLPLLASFLDEPFIPSPYEPVTRLFWNEFYLDVTRVEELKRCREARELLNSPAFRQEIAALQAAPLVDYRRGMAVKRRILELCARHFFAGNSGRQAAFRDWVKKNPVVQDYARFRATVEKRRTSWQVWPGRLRDGILREGDYDPRVEGYHLYVQWLAHRQFQDLAARARQNGQRLYLDLPLGVHRDGYDVWRERSVFALEANSGAPPDAFYSRGQDWGFPPLHPEGIREQGYRYYIAVVRHHLQHAGILRLDHVMGLHRLYWIPRGLSAREGVYVRYRAEEFYAILALESQRYRALLVGEDLGNVPGSVRSAMKGHNINRMYVLPFEYTGNTRRVLRPIPARALVCLNTHDMPPFAAFWLGKDASERVALPVFLYHQGRLALPTNKTGDVTRACLAHLAASRARILLVNLEDLWLETAPQNIPGTVDAYPNWRRKARYTVEEFSQKPEVLQVLKEISYLRNTNICGPLICKGEVANHDL